MKPVLHPVFFSRNSDLETLSRISMSAAVTRHMGLVAGVGEEGRGEEDGDWEEGEVVN